MFCSILIARYCPLKYDGAFSYGASLPQLGLPQSLMRRLWRPGKGGEIKENFSWLKENAAAKQVNNLLKESLQISIYIKFSGDIAWL